MSMDQMPAAPNSGPAPVPYGGGDQSPAVYDVPASQFSTPGPDVMSGVAGAMGVQEAGYAHNPDAGLCTPYYAGDVSPVAMPGSGPEGSDDVSGTVGGAVAAAEARFLAHMNDGNPQGSAIGVQLDIPQNSMDPAVGVQGFEGSYYDPPRDY